MIPTQEENPSGLNARYHITRTDGTPISPEAEYFVLRVDTAGRDKAHLVACRLAVLAYADSIAATRPELARDIYSRYNAHPEDGALLKTEPHI